MIERDGVALLMGEITSASALTISQVAARNKKLFLSIGARSDALRGKDCNRYTFHVDIPVTVMVNAAGQALLRDNMVKGKKIFSLTADYLFGHDLSTAAKTFFAANGGTLIGDELVATDVTDFSPYLLKIRQARPDVVSTNLAGNQVTNFVKQYAEFGLPYPGGRLQPEHRRRLGRRRRQPRRHLAHGLAPRTQHAGIEGLRRGVHEEARQAAGEPRLDRVRVAEDLAQAMNETKSTDTDKLIAYFESEAQFDLLKARKALLPHLGPPADAGGLSVHRQGQGPGQGQVGLPEVRRRGAGAEPAAGPAGPDQGARTPARCSTPWRAARGRPHGGRVSRRRRLRTDRCN